MPTSLLERRTPETGALTRKTGHELSAPTGGAAGAHRFVLSTENRDLEGDVVVQAGLELVSERIPAQVDHSGQMKDLIGHWRNVTTAAKRTTGDLVLLEKGLSPTADLVRSLLDAGVRLAASIGFIPKKTVLIREPDDDSGRVTGYRFERSTLLEASVVVVPANPEALSFAKSLLCPDDRIAFEQLLAGGRVTHRAPTSGSRPRAATGGTTMPTLAERITAAEAALVEQRDALEVAQASLADDATEAAQAEYQGLLERVNRAARSLDLLRQTETALAAGAAPAGQQRAVSAQPAAASAPAIVRRRPKPDANLIVRSAVLALEAHVKHASFDEVLARRYPNDEGLAMVGRMCMKAAQNPAMTNVPAWAGELVRDTYAAFMELLAPEAVVPRIPFTSYSFDGYNSIKIPKRNKVTTPNLAAAFRAEGAPIRVGGAQIGSATLTPKSMGVIGTFTNELFERSTPNIETEIRAWMLSDTAIMLDGYFLSNTAAIAGVSPGGILAALPAGDTRPSSGKTVAQITADLQAMVAAMGAANLLKRPVWIMNPVNASWLAFSINAVGAPAFPGVTIQGGTLVGYPVLTSTTVPVDLVALIDGAGVAFAGGAPKFLGSDVATLHEEGDPTLVSPISTAGTPNVIAAPVRSLFQTNSAAPRALWELDWDKVIDGAVQALTGVNWK